ncbi:hypothetical protein B0O99DRAFT_646755 [Bisporella sp. PMI_857]|nr:hypothetical protein B0O99DRAFT_646755 [Bisporella sp. PMI_857]
MKAAPKLHDSSWNQGKKAFISVIRESELDKIDLALKTNCDLLLQSGTYHSMSWLEKKDPNFLQQMVNFIVPQQQVYDSARRSDSTSVAPVFMVPFQRDPKYLRRPAIMEEIASRFKNQCQVALAGLGGVGKSQVAIEYCYLFRDENPHAHVFWIYAGTTSRFEQGYQEMARRLTLLGWDDPKVDTLKLVYEWLLRCVREFNRA